MKKILNFFEKTYNEIKTEVAHRFERSRRISKLKAEYKTCVATLEEAIIADKADLQRRITSDAWSFPELVDNHKSILDTQQRLHLTHMFYNSLFVPGASPDYFFEEITDEDV